ncbi:hypothetical protein AB4140_06375 [Shewanella sp. 10N.286.51.B2]|uniref:CRISPR-associated ring nuclease n=1 Tax=Shewanella sp. 10N.286.51.B2 TaxID=3229707 RepID=UPI00354B7491
MINFLVNVTGASPQVFTEILYVLYKRQTNPSPDEVFVITTKNSKQTVIEGLFERVHWQQLILNYSLTCNKFDKTILWVITDEQGSELENAKGEDDQSWLRLHQKYRFYHAVLADLFRHER